MYSKKKHKDAKVTVTGNISSGYCSDSSIFLDTQTHGKPRAYKPNWAPRSPKDKASGLNGKPSRRRHRPKGSILPKCLLVLSILQIVVGVCCMISSMVSIAMDHWGIYYGSGFWGGAIFVMTGVLGLFAFARDPGKFRTILVGHVLAFAVCSLMLSLVVATFAAIAIARSYLKGLNQSAISFHYIALLLAFFETVLSSFTAVVCSFMLCRKLHKGSPRKESMQDSYQLEALQKPNKSEHTEKGKASPAPNSNVKKHKIPRKGHSSSMGNQLDKLARKKPPSSSMNLSDDGRFRRQFSVSMDNYLSYPNCVPQNDFVAEACVSKSTENFQESKANQMISGTGRPDLYLHLQLQHQPKAFEKPRQLSFETSTDADSSMIVVGDDNIFDLDMSAIPLPSPHSK